MKSGIQDLFTTSYPWKLTWAVNLMYSYFMWYFGDTELDALEADMGMEDEADGVPSYLQPDRVTDFDAELNLPSAPSGHAAAPSRANAQAEDEHGLPSVPRATLRG